MPLSAYIHRTQLTDANGVQTENVNQVATLVWDSIGLAWVKATQAGGGGGGGTQYAEGTTINPATGTVALGKNTSNVVSALSLDGSGNLNVNLAAGTISGGNAAASPTGAAVPASAGYTGWKSGANLVGVELTNALPVQPGTGAVFPAGQNALISTNNSSTTPLGAGGTFTGTSEDITGYSTIGIMAFSDKAGTVFIDYSTNSTNWDYTDSIPLAANTAITIQNEPHGQYYRIRLVNGGVAQGVLRLQTIYQSLAMTQNKVQISDTLAANDTAILTKGVIVGVTTGGGGGYVDVKVNPSGALTADVTQSGTWTVQQGTPPWSVSQSGAWSIGRTWALSSGTDSVTAIGTFWQATQPVSGPLTDTQLRLTPVPVSGTFWQATQPVSGTFWQATQPVSLASTTITGSVAVTGPLTDTQLRASAVPVSLASTTITGSVAVTGPLTDTQLRASAVPVSLASTTITGSVAVTGPLTDAQLRATPVPTKETRSTANARTSVAGAAADTLILASNANRLGATVYNDSAAILYLSLGTAAASTTDFTVKMVADAYYEVPFGYTGAIRGIWASATGSARVGEIT
jgi:hypothetical protein